MKRLFLVLLPLMVVTMPLSAQDTSKVMISKSELTPAQLRVAQQASRVDELRPWVGMGKEVGEAVNSSLAAVTEQTSKFADTNVGRFTMFIVAWKVLGEDILGFVWGFAIIFIGVPIVVWSYRKHCYTQILVRQVTDPTTKKVTEQEWRSLETGERDMRDLAKFFHAIGLLIILVASAIAIF